MSLGGADWIAIDAAGLDLGSPAPLDGVIESDDDRGTDRHQDIDQQQQQMLGRDPRRPRRPVEDAMESAEIGSAVSAQDAQRCRDGPLAWGEDGAGEQQRYM